MTLPVEPIPAPGFQIVSGKRNPPDDGSKYEIQFRSGFVDRKHQYSRDQIRWLWREGKLDDFDVVAVRRV